MLLFVSVRTMRGDIHGDEKFDEIDVTVVIRI